MSNSAEKKHEAWLIYAPIIDSFDGESVWYVLHGDFLQELKQRVWQLRKAAVSVAHDVADGAYSFHLVSSIYPDLDGFLHPVDHEALHSVVPEPEDEEDNMFQDVYQTDPVPIVDEEGVRKALGLKQYDMFRWSGGITLLHVSGLNWPYAYLRHTTKCDTTLQIDLPSVWFDELKREQQGVA
jgi:hypothetical protein